MILFPGTRIYARQGQNPMESHEGMGKGECPEAKNGSIIAIFKLSFLITNCKFGAIFSIF